MTEYAAVLAHLNYKDLIIQKELGQGKFGKVHKAHCEKLNRVVAVKIISDSKIFKIEEIEILVKSTAHDNVISIKDVIMPVNEEDKYWIVMEYCDYNVQQIRDRLPDNRIPWARWASVMKDILAGLIYLHERNFVHCDLKPENVLVNDRFEAKIADVGLSRIAGEPYITSENDDLELVHPSGTLLYISPERLQDPGKAPAFADDYYSCGLLFYKMITNGDLFYLKSTDDEEARITSMKLWVCETQWRHPLEKLKKFQTPPDIATAIEILWDIKHTNRIADKAQKVMREVIIKHRYDHKQDLEEADKYLKNLMDDNVPSNPQPESDEVDSVEECQHGESSQSVRRRRPSFQTQVMGAIKPSRNMDDVNSSIYHDINEQQRTLSGLSEEQNRKLQPEKELLERKNVELNNVNIQLAKANKRSKVQALMGVLSAICIVFISCYTLYVIYEKKILQDHIRGSCDPGDRACILRRNENLLNP